MKWLKKVTKWLKAEEEYEIKEIVLDENEELNIEELTSKGVKVTSGEDSKYIKKQKKQKTEPNRNLIDTNIKTSSEKTENGEINVNVSYQYPKGAFRFPVIPDQFGKDRGRQRIRTTDRRTAGYSDPIKGPKLRTVKSTPAHLYPQIRQVRKQGHIQVEEPKKKPFRPSEIPSPIYGFQKRPPRGVDSSFEYELTSSLNYSSIQKDIPAVFRKEPSMQKEQTLGVNPVDEQIRMADPIEAENRPVPEELTASAEEIKSAAITEVLTEPAADERFKPIESTQTISAEMDSHNEEIAPDQDEPLLETVIPDYYQEEEIVQTVPEEISAEEQETAVLPNVKTDEAPMHTPVTADETVRQEESEESGEEMPQAPKRSNIPFNVVMLSQDRKKWMQKQQNTEKKTPKDQAIRVVESSGTNALAPSQKEEVQSSQEASPNKYERPSLGLLAPPVIVESDEIWVQEQTKTLNETLHNFNVRAKVVNATQGPAVTQFEVQPEPGVKVNKITNLTDDIKLCLAAQDIRIEAPIPGKHTIGIEIPNRKSKPVFVREVLDSAAFKNSDSPLTVALGLDITGSPVITDLRKMPHGLIAGATGSGKSVCINTMLVSLLYKASPKDVRVLLIDPKVVELAPYNAIPHLVSPVITDVKAATAALKWAVDEMERRYELFAHTGVRDLSRFNQKAEASGQYHHKLPYILIVIDELADLMMMSPADVEEAVCRIAQKARACGIHLIVATQRPSVDVITGLIKSNIPTRIAFSVSSQVDSRTIIDVGGAEKLLGRGDMLFLENGSSKTVRLQGTYVSDEEIEEVVDFVKQMERPEYLFQQEDLLAKAHISDVRDDLFLEACEFVVYQNAASASGLQRRFHIGYSRAGRIIDMMEEQGIVSEARGSRPREVLMTIDELNAWKMEEQG